MSTVTRPRPTSLASLPPLVVPRAEKLFATSERPRPRKSPLPPMPVNRREFSIVLDPRHGTLHCTDPRPFVARTA